MWTFRTQISALYQCQVQNVQNNKLILGSLAWALTSDARDYVIQLRSIFDCDLDLAIAVLDEQIASGLLKESDVYTLPPKKKLEV